MARNTIEGNSQIYITVNVSSLLLASRLIQIIGAVSVFSFALALITYHTYNVDIFQYRLPMWTLVPILAITPVITLTGVVGMFAYKRPRDVHWHLTLGLDYLTLVLTAADLILAILASVQTNYWTNGFYIAMDICTASTFCAMLIPIICTHRLERQRAMTAPDARKEALNPFDEEHSMASRSSSYPTAPPSQVLRREPSQAVSRADTVARWSGISGSTTAFPAIHSEMDTSSHSPASSIVKD